jgi:glycine C-acetyltransferase
MGLITAITDRSTEIFSDRLNHASIVDAALVSRAHLRRYPHNDITALEDLLKSSTAARKLIITEGVFSMDGDIAPLKEIISLLEPYNALLYLDEAHATGTIGPRGRGTLEALGIAPGNPHIIEMGTLGKAFGSFGAFVAGSSALKALLTTKARSFIYTTALPPAICAASIKALDIVDKNPSLVASLQKNASFIRDALNAMGLNTMSSSTQIIPILVGETGRTMEISEELFRNGVFIQGIRPPTVPVGTSRLRITVSAAHSRQDLEMAVDLIRDCFKKGKHQQKQRGESCE